MSVFSMILVRVAMVFPVTLSLGTEDMARVCT